MVDIVIFDLNLAQHLVPTQATFGLDNFQIVFTKFLEVTLGLLRADERRGDAGVDLFATAGTKCYNGARYGKSINRV